MILSHELVLSLYDLFGEALASNVTVRNASIKFCKGSQRRGAFVAISEPSRRAAGPEPNHNESREAG
jgi:hypothetical protein